MKPFEQRLLTRLSQSGVMTPADIERAIAKHETAAQGASLAETLVANGLAPSREVYKTLAELSGFRFVDVRDAHPEDEARNTVEASYALRHNVLPLSLDAEKLTVAMADPTDVYVCDELARRNRRKLVTLFADPIALREAIRIAYGAADNPSRRMSLEEIAIVREEKNKDAALDPNASKRLLPPPPPVVAKLNTPRPIPNHGIAPPAPAPVPVPHTPERVVIPSDDGVSAPDAETREVSMLNLDMQVTAADEGTISQAETVFEENNPIAQQEVERQRISSGAYRIGERAEDSAVGETSERSAPAINILNALIEESAAGGAEAIEFLPLSQSVRIRARFGEGWRELAPYPFKYHEPVVRRMRLLADVLMERRDLALERRFKLETKKGELLVCAHFEPSLFGERVVLRFPEKVPLLADPFREIGLPAEEGAKREAELVRVGGGLAFITTPSARTAARLYASVMRRYASIGRDVLSIERVVERTLPGVTQISAPTQELQLAALSNASFMNPNLVGIAAIENGTVLNALLALAGRGISCVGFFNARDSETGLACLRAARVDPMTLIQSLSAYLHVQEAPVLCPACRRLMGTETGKELPQWARHLEGVVFEAPGCPQCLHTGRVRTEWMTELFVPDRALADGSFLPRVQRTQRLEEMAQTGLIDPRDFPG